MFWFWTEFFFSILNVNFLNIYLKGAYYCGTCKPGYVGSGNGTCRLGDYCAIGLHNCHDNATCIPISAGKFKCKVKKIPDLQIPLTFSKKNILDFRNEILFMFRKFFLTR